MANDIAAPSSSLPQPLSYDQILSNSLSAYVGSSGVQDLNVGGAMVSFMKVSALSTARASADIFQLLRDLNLSRATGPALQNLAIGYGIIPQGSKVATGTISIIDLSFQKLATKIYAGQNPPNQGSTTIYVSDASKFPSSGAIYIGRGSPNVEGPLSYSTKTQIGSYWSLSLIGFTTRYHNSSESVILAQGGVRQIPSNTIVISPGIGTTPDISYSTSQTAVILDGETTVTNVPIVALNPGAVGNVPANAISEFSSNPSGLPNASVTNPSALTTGADTETDPQLRVRVKNALASTGLGTVTAIKSAIQNLQDPSSSNTIVSSDVLQSPTSTVVYIDNGSGYEAIHDSVGIETIVTSALGGEKFFQLVTGGTQTSVTKAFLQSVNAAPYNLSGGEVLTIIVGNVTYNHTFQVSDFANPGSATAYEVCASLNGDTALNYEAVTQSNGNFVVIRPKDEITNTIQVTTPPNSQSIDANGFLFFPSQKAQTLRLYKNSKLLTQDGSEASVFTQPQSLWSQTISSGETLVLSVDGTQYITYVLTDAMFIAEGTYTSLSYSNSLQSWVNVLNTNITGITASIVGSTIQISSNLGAVNRAQISVSISSTLISKGMFSSSSLASSGVKSDYVLDRNTAQIQLAVALVAGDTLSCGTLTTQANIEGSQVISGSVTLTADAHVWIAIDSPSVVIPTIRNGSNLTVSLVGNNTIRYTSNSVSAFSNVLAGDYVIVWSQEIPTSDRLEGRVHAVTPSTLDIKVTAAEYAAATPIVSAPFIQGFVATRTAKVPQKFRVQAGTKTLNAISAELQTQSDEIVFGVVDNTSITVTTNSDDSVGYLVMVTADSFGALMGFATSQSSSSQDSLIAFYDSGSSSAELPLFFHSTISVDSYAAPIDSYLTSITSSSALNNIDTNSIISFLSPYGGIDDQQPTGENVQISTLAGSAITILPEYPDVRRLRQNDRFYVASPLDFGYNDSAVVIIDNNTVGETYTLPLQRTALTNSAYANNSFSFNAYDIDSGAGTPFSQNFLNFDFSNFKALMQAKRVVQGSNAQTALLYRSTQWGRSGEHINVSYVYPTSANQPIGSVVTVNDTVNVSISLQSGTVVTSGTDSSTQWNVTVASNTPSVGIDQLSYAYNGIGSPPNLSLSGGEYVNILPSTGFASSNKGAFRVSTAAGFSPTLTRFSVQVPTGTGTPQSNIVTGVTNGISFYNSSSTTAFAINSYVNASLSQYVTTTIVNDGGITGSGVIALSSYEDSGFTTQNSFLKDGLNWIASSNIASSPQFTLKKALTYPSDTGYTFNGGEVIQIVPTTMDQVQKLWSVLAVTGFTTGGTVDLVARGTKVQLSTTTLGSVGSIQVVGGSGNQFVVPALTSGQLIDTSHMLVSVSSIAGQAMTSGQWFRLQAEVAQNKNSGIAPNTSVTILNNAPISGQSTISLLGQIPTQRYFGSPRNNTRVENNTFRVERQGSLSCISWNGVGTSPYFSKSVNLNDTGWTCSVTLNGVYTVTAGSTNLTGLSIGDIIAISGMANSANNGTFIVEGVTGSTLTTSNSASVVESGTVLVAGNFSSTTSVSEGDTVVISSPFSPLNQGEYRVIRMSADSIWIENPDVLEEEVTCLPNTVSTSYDATSQFNISDVNGIANISWNGIGTQPLLGLTLPGDIATLGVGFSSPNQGSFMIQSSGPSQQQIALLTMPSGATFAASGPGDYFEIWNGGNANAYYVWYNVSGGSNTDPAPIGFVGIEVTINLSDSSNTIAIKTVAAMAGMIATTVSANGAVITVTSTLETQTNTPISISMPTQFSIVVAQTGQRSFMNLINPSVTPQSGAVSVSLSINRPQMQFFPYDCSVPGDVVSVNGATLGAGNAGSYRIVQILSPTTAIVAGNISQQYITSLASTYTSFSITEGTPYTGYKQIYLVAAQPGSTSYDNIVLNTIAQYDKINPSAGVAFTSLAKLNFPTSIKTGIDSYSFDTGLIGVANRTVYGDPRDSVTYPGVSAAGSSLFFREPLLKRVQISLAVRTNTGVSFPQVTSQIQSAVYSLILANPLGQSIDLSSIVEAARSVIGVTSVVMINPSYDINNDEIQLQVGQKAYIVSQNSDINVSLIGG